MTPDPRNLMTFCEMIAQSTDEELTRLDREGLNAMTVALKDLKEKVDRTLLRLALVAVDGGLH